MRKNQRHVKCHLIFLILESTDIKLLLKVFNVKITIKVSNTLIFCIVHHYVPMTSSFWTGDGHGPYFGLGLGLSLPNMPKNK